MQTARLIRVGDVTFSAVQSAEHPDVVFLHGFGDDLSTWDLLWREWGPQLRGLRYDLRGFGQSHCDAGTAYSHSDDLLQLLDTLNLETVSLVGVSMGGSVALNFALSYPQRVDKLVLISPGLAAWEWSDEWKALWRPILQAAADGDLDRARQLWWQHPLFAASRNSDAAALLRDAILRYSGRHWIVDNERDTLPDVDRLHSLAVDTLLITGARDVDEFRLIADLIGASSERVKRIDFAEAGHLPHIEIPADCAAVIRSFLSASVAEPH